MSPSLCYFMTALMRAFSLDIILCLASTFLPFSRIGNPFLTIGHGQFIVKQGAHKNNSISDTAHSAWPTSPWDLHLKPHFSFSQPYASQADWDSQHLKWGGGVC